MPRSAAAMLLAGAVCLGLTACRQPNPDWLGPSDESNSSDPTTGDPTTGDPTTGCAGMVCDGECIDVLADPNNCGDCDVVCEGLTPVCRNGECACPESEDYGVCEGACVDLTRDGNCGECGKFCDDQVCRGGECKPNCGPADECANTCVDLDTDPEHCGMCDNPCADGEQCVAKACVAA